jgi:hypothetical protein|tara:strand:+ start:894 stop:1481 length:588 start_codon:yes stop_codon:yes gene_type:complete
MKILFFTDVHSDKESLETLIDKSKDCDIMVCCGDISEFGSGLKKSINMLKKTNKKVLITHGNHERITELSKLCDNENVIFLHKNYYVFDDVMFAAYGGGGFSEMDERLDEWVNKFKSKKRNKLILFTHAPPLDTKLDKLPWLGHRGSRSVRRAIETLKPEIFACGHFHETFSKKDYIGKSKLLNPGNFGTVLEIR